MDRTEKQRLTFIKALLGVAWIEKSVNAELLNVLKTYLRRVNTSEEENVALKPYLQKIVREPEGHELIAQYLTLLVQLPHPELQSMFDACRELTEIDTDETDFVFVEQLPQLFQPGMAEPMFVSAMLELLKKGGIAEPPAESRRVDDLDEFVRARIMHSVKSKMLDLRLGGDLSPKEVAYITSLSALLGRIAHADEDFSEEEKVEITGLLKESTTLGHQDIDIIMSTIIDDTLRGLDLKMITRTFYNLTTPEQREQLLGCLYLVAGADGHIDKCEVDEIERIAVGLNMSHRELLRCRANAMDIVRKRLSPDDN